MASLIAARRDASFYRCPAGHGADPKPSKFHAIVERDGKGRGPACGIALHDEDTEEPAYGLLDSEKCRKPGCRKVFEADKETPQ